MSEIDAMHRPLSHLVWQDPIRNCHSILPFSPNDFSPLLRNKSRREKEVGHALTLTLFKKSSDCLIPLRSLRRGIPASVIGKRVPCLNSVGRDTFPKDQGGSCVTFFVHSIFFASSVGVRSSEGSDLHQSMLFKTTWLTHRWLVSLSPSLFNFHACNKPSEPSIRWERQSF